MEFVVHLTRLADGTPRTGGPLTFLCDQEGAAVFEQTAAAPARPGIYEAELTYPAAGIWGVTLVFPTDAGQERIVLPPVRVHRGAGEAAAAEIPVSPEGISFLKEQQWPIPMLTVPAAPRVINGARVLTIPASAMRPGTDEPSVFVQLDGETFEERHPVLGKSDGVYVTVTSGIDPGERVVTQGLVEVLRAANSAAGGHDLKDNEHRDHDYREHDHGDHGHGDHDHGGHEM